MIKRVLKHIRDNHMIEAGETVVVGVSGGVDSICLLNIMKSLKAELDIRLVAVHLNHGIRKNAERDSSFVALACTKLGIEYEIYEMNIPDCAKKWGMSLEEAGRKCRYGVFEDTIKKYSVTGKGKIAVAHNADDNAETILHNLFRGSGIKGISGIQPVRDNVIRPVLCVTRKEIEEYLEENNIEYVNDETNFETEYTRNKIRLKLLPMIVEEINARAAEHINMAGRNLSEINDYIESQGKKKFEEIVQVSGADNSVYVASADYGQLHPALKSQVVKQCIYTVAGREKDITRQHIESVGQLFDMTVGKMVDLPYEIRAVKQYDGVVIESTQRDIAQALNGKDETLGHPSEVTISGEGVYKVVVDGQIRILKVERDEYNEQIFEQNRYTKWIDCDIMKGDLQFRTRRAGDYIIVDEKGSKKKLKDFFIDEKIPKNERDNICLLTRRDEVIWVVGHRLSAAYKVKDGSQYIYRFCLEEVL